LSDPSRGRTIHPRVGFHGIAGRDGGRGGWWSGHCSAFLQALKAGRNEGGWGLVQARDSGDKKPAPRHGRAARPRRMFARPVAVAGIFLGPPPRRKPTLCPFRTRQEEGRGPRPRQGLRQRWAESMASARRPFFLTENFFGFFLRPRLFPNGMDEICRWSFHFHQLEASAAAVTDV